MSGEYDLSLVQAGQDYFDALESCDRRLSRAARKLVRDLALHSLDPVESIADHKGHDVWELLDHWLGRAPPSCPLLPTYDILRHDEEQTQEIKPPSKNLIWAYPTHTLQQRRLSHLKEPKTWFQCSYCNKVFASRFYLDVHMANHHRYSDADEESMICPALDWCKVVGLANCHHQALEDEPYYGRGSAGLSDDRKLIKHGWTKVAHNVYCDQQRLREECRSILQLCSISFNVCDTVTCPTHHFWHLPSQWGDRWLKEAGHHPGILGIAISLGLIVWLNVRMKIFKRILRGSQMTSNKRLLTTSKGARSSRKALKKKKKD